MSIEKKYNAKSIYNKLKEDIFKQHYIAGQRLIEEELASQFQVSRTPIRQALQHLAIDGFVEIKPYRGAFVKRLSPDELKDLFQVRIVLERLAAELFCNRPNDEVIKKLELNLLESEKAMIQKDLMTYASLDEEFHQLIMQGSNNKEVYTIAQQLNQKTYIFRLRSFTLEGQMEKSFTEHRQIIQCLLNNQSAEAGKAAEKHVKGVLNAFYNYLHLERVFK